MWAYFEFVSRVFAEKYPLSIFTVLGSISGFGYTISRGIKSIGLFYIYLDEWFESNEYDSVEVLGTNHVNCISKGRHSNELFSASWAYFLSMTYYSRQPSTTPYCW